MDAHVAIEQGQAAQALLFLAKISEPDRLEAGLQAVYYSTKGQAETLLKNYEIGQAAFKQAIAAYEQDLQTTPLQIEWVYNWIGLAHYEQGEITQALVVHRRCMQAVFEGRIKDDRFKAKVCLNLGNDYLLAGHKTEALKFYRQAVEVVKDTEDRPDLAALYWAMGLVFRGQKKLGHAKLYLGKSLAQYIEQGDLVQAARVRNLLGLVMADRQEYEDARQALLSAYSAADAFPAKDYVTLSSCSTNLALLYLRQENWADAEEWGQRSLTYAEKLGNRLQLSQAQAQLAEIKLNLGKEAETTGLFEAAIANIELTSILEIAGEIYFRYGSALKQMGNILEALNMMDKGYRAKAATPARSATTSLARA